MALQTIGGIWLPRWPVPAGTPTFNWMTLDAASEKAAMIVRAPKTGTVSKLAFGLRTVTTGATVDVRLETVDATTGNPTGTLFGTTTNGALVIADTDDNTWKTVTMTLGASVTLGDLMAVVVVNPAVSPGNFEVIAYDDEQTFGARIFPYQSLFTAAWDKATPSRAPVVALEYSDGSYAYIPGAWAAKALTQVQWASDVSPNHRGLRFKVPFKCRVAGFWALVDLLANVTVELIGSDGSTVLTSRTLDKDVIAGGAGLVVDRFPSPQILNADTFYRCVISPDTISLINHYRMDYEAAAILDATEGGQNFHYTTANNPTLEADWTQTLTQQPYIGLMFDQLSDDVGGGGSVSGPLVNSGLVIT